MIITLINKPYLILNITIKKKQIKPIIMESINFPIIKPEKILLDFDRTLLILSDVFFLKNMNWIFKKNTN